MQDFWKAVGSFMERGSLQSTSLESNLVVMVESLGIALLGQRSTIQTFDLLANHVDEMATTWLVLERYQ